MTKEISPPSIMGILNLTPDSFFDGGRYATVAEGVERGVQMASEGAAIIDVGGESTRPGARRVSGAEQCSRILEVVKVLRAKLNPEIVISIDTTLSEVAAAAIERGAGMVNDISAGRDDPDMLKLVAKRGVSMVMMHMKGRPESMQLNPEYSDLLAEVEDFFRERLAAAISAGVARHRLILDPGIGFGKRREHNLLLMRSLARLKALGQPLLLGVSRKRFMGSICSVTHPAELLPATCGATALGVMAGVDIFRVHDVAENRQVADMAWAIRKASATVSANE